MHHVVRAAPKPVIVLLGTVWNTLSPVDTEYELPSFLPLMSSISYFVLTVEVDIGTRFFGQFPVVVPLDVYEIFAAPTARRHFFIVGEVQWFPSHLSFSAFHISSSSRVRPSGKGGGAGEAIATQKGGGDDRLSETFVDGFHCGDLLEFHFRCFFGARFGF